MMLRRALPLIALAASSLAWGEALDAQERVARLSYVEGEMTFQGAHEPVTNTLPERPLAPGDRLDTGHDGRAELALGTATIRLDEQTKLEVAELDDTTVRVELTAGTAIVHLRELYQDETFEIVTPNTAITLDEPGEYRADISAGRATALTVRSGSATVATAGGPVRVAAGQRVRMEGRDALARLETARSTDAFDEWVLERELQLAEAEPARYTPYEGEDYEELDRHGEWYDEPRYGRVWMPGYGYSNWSPYRYGSWQRVGFGWSWYDPAPWGFFTFHSGRWAYLNHLNRWCWVPGPRFHGRNFAHDNTRPFRWPRGGTRERVTPEAAPRTAFSPSNTGDVAREPVVTSGSNTRRDVDERRVAPRREAAAGERARGTTYARGGGREPRAAAPVAAPAAAPAAAAPRGGGTTARPARAEPPARPARAEPPARSRSESSSDRPQGRSEPGTRYNTP